MPERSGAVDQLQLRGLRFSGVHGALPDEHHQAQPFEVDVDLFLDLRAAGASDDLGATVDYGRLCEVVRSVIEGPHVTLLENLAERIADGTLAASQGRGEKVLVTVRKLRPPVPVPIASAGVHICRP